MVKTRMGLLDLRVQTAILDRSLRGARVTNIYDAHNGRTYILKLSIPPVRTHHSSTDNPVDSNDSLPSPTQQIESASSSTDQTKSHTATSTSSGLSTGWQKRLLLIESGVRCHMTHFDREKDVPSGFCLKLRKHIRARRLHAVRQLGKGGDRIIDIVFSSEGNVIAHLIIEAFAGGNVILTTEDYNILTLLRTYRIEKPSDSGDRTRVAVRERYPVENARELVTLDRQTFDLAVKEALEELPTDTDITAKKTRVARRKLQALRIAKGALAIKLSIEPNLIQHALLLAGFEADVPLKQVEESKGFDKVFDELCILEKDLQEQMEKGKMKGYVVYSVNEIDGERKEKYEEFTPFLFAQYKNRLYKEFPTFDDAADHFFSRVESERHGAAQAKKQNAAFKKVDKLATELKGQVQALENARDDHWHRAQAIESNITEVDAAIKVIRSAIAAAVTWDGLAKMVEEEKANGNPIAEIIHSLQLDRNEITLLLEDAYGMGNEEEEENTLLDEDDDDLSTDASDEETDKDDVAVEPEEDKRSRKKGKNIYEPSSQTRQVLKVPVDIGLGAHANARQYYDMRKTAAAKMEKAVEVTDRTIKAASRKAANEASRLEKEAVAASIRALRKPLWFEKFYWFISSEDYLVVAGRDTQQNEILVKRYLAPQDIYVHADLEGASSVIVKNKKGDRLSYSEIPLMTLEQAGTFAMSRSAAWDAKMVSSAWWVKAIQVSKTGPDGTMLPVGSFGIRGRKNFLDPTRLVMGIGFVFKLDDESTKKRVGERFNMDRAMIENAPHKATETASSSIEVSGKDEEDSADETDKQESESINPDKVSEAVTSSNYPDSEQSNDANAKNVTEEQIEEITTTADKLTFEEPTGTKEEKALRSTKKRMTAKQRRMLKQNNKSDEPMTEPQAQLSTNTQDANSTTTAAAGSSSSSIPTPKTTNNNLPRGKRHKLKKMRKYMDQDEEERRIALAVLGSKPIKEAENSTTTDQLQSDSITETNDESERSIDGKERRSTLRAHYDKIEPMRMTEEEGIRELERLAQETEQIMSTLYATPNVEDGVEYALAVCAPFDALSRYRYRVKLMPGSMKRGKAYRSALVLVTKQAEKDLTKFKKERDAIRLCPESDGILAMIGGVRIMASGLAEAQKLVQKEKKGGAAKKGKKK